MSHPRITINPKIKAGRPVITGTRIPVELLLKLLGQGQTIEMLLKSYPRLTREDILAAHVYAADHLPGATADVAEAAE